MHPAILRVALATGSLQLLTKPPLCKQMLIENKPSMGSNNPAQINRGFGGDMYLDVSIQQMTYDGP
jgi:hypothetical protein